MINATKYRKKPVVVEAFQMLYAAPVFPNPPQPPFERFPQWFKEAMLKPMGESGAVFMHSNGLLCIATLEGLMEISHGDFVIKGTRNEIYPCKPGPFADTFEAIKP